MKFAKVKIDENLEMGKLISDDKLIVIPTKDNDNHLIRVVPVDTIIDIIEVTAPLFKEIVELFNSLFRRLPTNIEYLGNNYKLTIQPAYGKLVDKVFYQIEKETEGVQKILFDYVAKGEQLFKAKNKIRLFMKDKGLFL